MGYLTTHDRPYRAAIYTCKAGGRSYRLVLFGETAFIASGEKIFALPEEDQLTLREQGPIVALGRMARGLTKVRP